MEMTLRVTTHWLTLKVLLGIEELHLFMIFSEVFLVAEWIYMGDKVY